MLKKRIVVFASGNGSNMECIHHYFSTTQFAEVHSVVCNKPSAGVIERANRLGIPVRMIDRNYLYESNRLSIELKQAHIDLIVLAGFMWLIPKHLIHYFPNRIINIHPALLPAYGGKGMYGMQIHSAVIRNKEKVSGITIHYVNEQYDEGKHIFQQSIPLSPDQTPEQLATRIHALEHEWYSQIIEKLLVNL
ncbi:MAG: phosphoribosylglycinamide formyltransferase [Bacteroidales bacterium]|nr:phosphoribosylglycinamide formyltransferase [Bacteroidales bacterium]